MKNFRGGLLLLLAVALLLPILIVGCAETEEPAGQERKELIIGLGRDFYYGPEDRTFLHGSTNVWESLVYLDESLNAAPWLAESFSSSEDGKVWTFQLKEGVLFHDGTSLNAEVAKANLLRLSNHPGTAQPYRELLEVRVTGEYTVEVELSAASPAFPEMISYFPSAMFSLNALAEEGNGLKEPIGTGPYVFEERNEDTIILKSNSDYWGGAPSIDTVKFVYIPDENTRVAALMAGEVDTLADVGVILPEQIPVLQADPQINLLTVDVLTSIYMFFQTEKAPFDAPELRRAVSLILDREELVERLLDGYGKPGESFIPPLASYWVNPAAAPEYDTNKARELVEEFLGEDKEIEILINANWARRWPILSIAQYLQTELGKQGFTAAIKSLEMGAYNDAVKAGEYHISFTPWTGSDPDSFFREWIHTEGSFNQSRGIGFSDARADTLILQAAAEMDREKRRALYFELQELTAGAAPIMPVYHDVTVYAARDYVDNFYMDFNFLPYLQSVTFKGGR